MVALAVAFIAIVVAIGSWFRQPDDNNQPSIDPVSKYSEQESAQAKKTMCEAYTKTTDALEEASGTTSEDPNVKYMIAVNIRLAIHANASYLREALLANPATPPELAQIFHNIASSYDEILMAQLAGTPAESFDRMNADLDKADADATEACK